MSGWHRDNPELIGTDADPWMMHESYRKAAAPDTIFRPPVDHDHEQEEAMTVYNIWDSDTRVLIGERQSRDEAIGTLTNAGLSPRGTADLLDLAGDPGDMAIEKYGFTVSAEGDTDAPA